MAGWMLYAVGSAAALAAMAWLAERGLVLLERPARWLWLGVMSASVAWPFVSSRVLGALPGGPGGEAGPAGPEIGPGAALAWPTGRAELLSGVSDALLVGAWCLASFLLLGVLLLSAETLKGDRRRWRSDTVAGERVFLSAWLGPAVVGAVHPRIVLPGWVLDLDERSQRLIVLHEREHVRAGDGRLLLGGLLLLVLLPWCLPLWWQFHRLRQAIETDCDARVLRIGVRAVDYAHALIAVARRRRRVALPLAALAPSKATLERRLRLIVSVASPGAERLGRALLATAALLSLGAAYVPAPHPPSLAALAVPLRANATEASAAEAGRPLPGGALPGDPGEERLGAEIRAHHSDAISSGLPAGSVIWFIVDRNGDVARTGIERATERDVEGRIRARYPTETSEWSLAWSDVPAGPSTADVVWFLPGS